MGLSGELPRSCPPCLQELLPLWPRLAPAVQETVFQAARVAAAHELGHELGQRLTLALAAHQLEHLVGASLEPARCGEGTANAAAEPDNCHLLSEAVAAFVEASEGAATACSEALLRPLQLLYLSGPAVGGEALRVRRRAPNHQCRQAAQPLVTSTPFLSDHCRICFWATSRIAAPPVGLC